MMGAVAGRAPSGSVGEYGAGTSGYSIDIIAGTGRSGEDSIVVGAGVRIGIAVGLSTISHCSKHSHLTAEGVMAVTSDDGAGEQPEDGLIVSVGVAATVWGDGARGGVIARSPMLFEAYKFECEDTIEPTTRKIKRITDIPLTNCFLPVLVSVCPRKTLLRSITNRCS